MKKPKTRRYILEITSPKKFSTEDIQLVLSENLSSTYLKPDEQKITVKNATASAIRKLGDQQT